MLLPLSALVMQPAQMSCAVLEVITNPQVVAAYKVTPLSAFVASIFNGVFGLLMAWILTRYRFPGRTLLDALMDIPFAPPTAVAGLTLASLFSVNGFYGEWLAKFDIKVTYTWLRRWPLPAFRLWCAPQPVLEDSLNMKRRQKRSAQHAGRVFAKWCCRNYLRHWWRVWRCRLPAASVSLAR